MKITPKLSQELDEFVKELKAANDLFHEAVFELGVRKIKAARPSKVSWYVDANDVLSELGYPLTSVIP